MESKTERFSLLMTPSEKEAAQRLAERHGVSVATAVRSLIREGARRKSVWPSERQAARQCLLSHDRVGAGRNHNRRARYLASGGARLWAAQHPGSPLLRRQWRAPVRLAGQPAAARRPAGAAVASTAIVPLCYSQSREVIDNRGAVRYHTVN